MNAYIPPIVTSGQMNEPPQQTSYDVPIYKNPKVLIAIVLIVVLLIVYIVYRFTRTENDSKPAKPAKQVKEPEEPDDQVVEHKNLSDRVKAFQESEESTEEEPKKRDRFTGMIDAAAEMQTKSEQLKKAAKKALVVSDDEDDQ